MDIDLMKKIITQGDEVCTNHSAERIWWTEGMFSAWVGPGQFVMTYGGRYFVMTRPREITP